MPKPSYRERRRERKQPETYRDISGDRRSTGKSLRKILVNAVLVVVVTYIAYDHTFGLNLPGGWPVYLVGGFLAIAIQGNTNWGILVIHVMSTWRFWPTGKASVNKIEPVTEPFSPDPEYREEFKVYIHTEKDLRYNYPFVVFEVQGTNRIVSWPGRDFLIVPHIVIKQVVLDWKTGAEVIRDVNYTDMRVGPDGVFSNADTTRADQHVEIPKFMLDVLKGVKGFRADVSIGGQFRGEDASRVDFALHPKYDFWAMKSIEWPSQLKEMAKMKAREDNALVNMTVSALSRANRMSADLGRGGGGGTPATPQPGPAPEKPWGDGQR